MTTVPGAEADLADLLREQWSVLRAWLEEHDVLARAEEPTDLPPWTVRDLVAHLGVGVVMLDEVEPAPAGTEPVDVVDYMSAYVPAAATIAAAAQEAAAAEPDVLAGLDAAAARAWTALARLDAPVVLGRRGPLTRADYLLTRLVELVVHGDDLHRACPDAPDPVLPEARLPVARALAAGYRRRTGTDPGAAHPDALDPAAWVRLATGRTSSDDPALPLL